jgi:HEAT repeat protein
LSAPPAAERSAPPVERAERRSARESTPRRAPPPADLERRSPDDDYDYQDPEDLALALEGLKNPDPEERSDAVLDIEPEGPGLQYLLEVVTDDPDPEVRIAAVSQLGDSESPEAITGMLTALNDANSEVILEAIDGLEYSADQNAIGNLEKLLQHPDPEVREAAEDAIDYLEE